MDPLGLIASPSLISVLLGIHAEVVRTTLVSQQGNTMPTWVRAPQVAESEIANPDVR
jgi:hypothetical protein